MRVDSGVVRFGQLVDLSPVGSRFRLESRAKNPKLNDNYVLTPYVIRETPGKLWFQVDHDYVMDIQPVDLYCFSGNRLTKPVHGHVVDNDDEARVRQDLKRFKASLDRVASQIGVNNYSALLPIGESLAFRSKSILKLLEDTQAWQAKHKERSENYVYGW